jgi:tight adherence protein C
MQDEVQIWLVIGSAFIAVTMITALAGNAMVKRQRLLERLAGGSLADGEAGGGGLGGKFSEWAAKLSWADDRFLGLDDAGLRSKARLDLIRAGYFSPDAAKNFVLVRTILVLLLPSVSYVVAALFFSNMTSAGRFILVIVFMLIGYVGPDAYVKRRQKVLVDEYRLVFPDFLDLLVVCMDAGASVNAALERVGRDIAYQSRALATNVELMVSEMRSGRSLVEALDSFTRRVGLEEAGSLSTLVKQSVELGTDISDALRVYGDEMRDKRLQRAEAKAHALPVKMTVPLGIFIFPVIMIVVLTPVVIKILAAFRAMH